VNLILIASILLGGPQAAEPVEDDARIEATFRIAEGFTGSDQRYYEWNGDILAVGVVLDTEESLVAYWQDGEWTPLTLEGN
jgi:hypothetical protein